MTNFGKNMSEDVNFNRLVIAGLEEAKTGLSNLQAQVHSQELNILEIKTKLSPISEELNKLLKLIRGDGDTDSAIASRVIKIENRISSLEDKLELQDRESQENIKGKWQLKAALIAGVFSIITSIISLTAILIPALFKLL
jgi:chromosome segregation ATPase